MRSVKTRHTVGNHFVGFLYPFEAANELFLELLIFCFCDLSIKGYRQMKFVSLSKTSSEKIAFKDSLTNCTFYNWILLLTIKQHLITDSYKFQ